MALLAPVAVLASAMPRMAAWPLAIAACAYGACSAWRESRRRPVVLAIAADAGLVDGARVTQMIVSWRGPLAFVRWRDADGRLHRRALWPDMLSPAQRRELRLAAPAQLPARGAPSVAP